MQQHIIDAVLRNAAKHEPRHGTPVEGWDQARDLRYLRTIVEKVGELASALANKHEHPMELGVIQIAGICLNWLQARGTTWAMLDLALELDDRKHPAQVRDVWEYAFTTTPEAARFHGAIQGMDHTAEWMLNTVRTLAPPSECFPVWHSIMSTDGYENYYQARRVST